jgi:hypothetical protein
MRKPIPVFISYAHKDASFLDELKIFLVPFERKKKIAVWTDDNILAGDKWNALIREKINESELMVFLVSPDFLASEYINNIEIKSAVENNKLIIIPVIVRPIIMSQFDLNSYQVVPSGAKPVDSWQSRDEAWVNVTTALSKVFDKINGENGETNNTYSTTLKKENITDKLVLSMIILLISISVFMFGYGLWKGNNFQVYASVAGIGLGLIGYFIGRRSFSS